MTSSILAWVFNDLSAGEPYHENDLSLYSINTLMMLRYASCRGIRENMETILSYDYWLKCPILFNTAFLLNKIEAMSNCRDVLNSVFCKNRGYNRKNLYLRWIIIADFCINIKIHLIFVKLNFGNNIDLLPKLSRAAIVSWRKMK